MFDVKKASEELAEKSYREIQKETAYKWASRAAASYEAVISTRREDKLAVWSVAEEYYHEAIEHAALVEDKEAGMVAEIQGLVEAYVEKAVAHLKEIFEVKGVDQDEENK